MRPIEVGSASLHRPVPRDEWLSRFAQAIELLRDGVRPSISLCERWLDGDQDPLEHWCATHPSLPWLNGLHVLQAARLLAGDVGVNAARRKAQTPNLLTPEAQLDEAAAAAEAIRAMRCPPVTLAFAMHMAVTGVDFRGVSKRSLAESVANGTMLRYLQTRGTKEVRHRPSLSRLVEALRVAIPELMLYQSAPGRVPQFPSQQTYMELLDRVQAILRGGAPSNQPSKP